MMIKRFLQGGVNALRQSMSSKTQTFTPMIQSSHQFFATKAKATTSKTPKKEEKKKGEKKTVEKKKKKVVKRKAEEPVIPPQDYINKELKFSTHNYHPLGVVIKSARGLYMKDVENKRYMDFLAAYSAVNQGHAHPKILSAFKNQLGKVALTSRAFHSDQLGETCQLLARHFKYDRVLMMNSGVEAVQSSIKIARKWAYQVKGVPADQARVIFATGNFMGRTIALIGASEEVERNHNFGPFGGMNFDLVEYNNIEAMKKIIEKSAKSQKNTAAVFLQPIQGEAGVIIPDKGYIKQVAELCKKHNILFIADEIQTGLGRTGKWTASQWDKVKPDVITLGKALGGGVYPVSAVLGSQQVMSVLTPGTHGSTFGGNPLACAVARASIQVLRDEGMVKNSATLGKTMTKLLNNLDSPLIQKVRNRGLMGAVQIKKGIEGATAWDLCMAMKENGLLAKPTHENIIRLTPPLIIKEQELERAFSKIQKSLNKLEKVAKIKDSKGSKEKGEVEEEQEEIEEIEQEAEKQAEQQEQQEEQSDDNDQDSQ